MKIVFKKDKDSEISVSLIIDGKNTDFSYVKMIKALIDKKEMESPEISDGFMEAEKQSINSMVTYINETISETKESDSSE